MLRNPKLTKLISMRMLPLRLEIPRVRFYPKLVLFASLFVFGAFSVDVINAQQRFSKHYPAGKNVHITLKNISGTITVESWNRDEIKLTATFDSPKANIAPRQDGDVLSVDMMADNREIGRAHV